MIALYVSVGVLVLLAGIPISMTIYSFFTVFYSKKRKALNEDEFEIPEGEIYEAFRDDMINWTKEARRAEREYMEIRSFDGLTLRGYYYECNPGGIVEILFHGYRGDGERDLSAGRERCFSLGRNALIVDQRASGKSDGSVITFGVNECRDCLAWIDRVIERFGQDVRIVLTGISMGAATVLMAAGRDLPKNVVCVLADCGYSSGKEIITKVVAELKLPAKLIYPLIKLGGRLFGHFNLDEDSPIEAVKRAKVPIIFIHGDADDFVPYSMSERMYEACASKKKLVPIKGAGHGLAYPVDKALYISSLDDFRKECGF